ncbi:hypothetical protein U1Q18_007941, partial [Sarracenia purpurea var. burkii]
VLRYFIGIVALKKCFVKVLKTQQPFKQVYFIESTDLLVLEDVDIEVRDKAVENLELVPLNPTNLEKLFLLSSPMKEEEKENMIFPLKANIEVFSWSAFDMPSVKLKFILHELSVSPVFKLIE